MKFKAFIRGLKRLIISVIKNDFYGMAAEMDETYEVSSFPAFFLLCFFLLPFLAGWEIRH